MPPLEMADLKRSPKKPSLMAHLPTRSPSDRKGHWLAVAGSAAQIISLLLMLRTVATLVHSVTSVDPHPERGAMMNPYLGEVLWIGLFGMASTFVALSVITAAVALPGALLIYVSIYSRGYRAVWLYRLLMTVGMVYLAVFPVGTVLGAAFLVLARSKKREFRSLSAVQLPIQAA